MDMQYTNLPIIANIKLPALCVSTSVVCFPVVRLVLFFAYYAGGSIYDHTARSTGHRNRRRSSKLFETFLAIRLLSS